MKLLQGKPVHIRKRIAAIATGSVALILIVVLILIYSHPHPVKHDPEVAIVHGYSFFISKIGSLFHRK